MAVDRVEHPRERQTENGTDEECREDGFLLPLNIKRRTRHEVDCN